MDSGAGLHFSLGASHFDPAPKEGQAASCSTWNNSHSDPRLPNCSTWNIRDTTPEIYPLPLPANHATSNISAPQRQPLTKPSSRHPQPSLASNSLTESPPRPHPPSCLVPVHPLRPSPLSPPSSNPQSTPPAPSPAHPYPSQPRPLGHLGSALAGLVRERLLPCPHLFPAPSTNPTRHLQAPSSWRPAHRRKLCIQQSLDPKPCRQY
jgi:hypothetical protein